MVVMIEWHYYLWSSSLLTTLTRAYPLHNNSVGFDIRGDIKIFDFGLAKELAHLEPDEKGLYKLTGMSKWSVGRSVGRSVDCRSIIVLLTRTLFFFLFRKPVLLVTWHPKWAWKSLIMPRAILTVLPLCSGKYCK